MAKTNTYSSSIRTSKKEDFDIFLKQIGVSDDEVNFELRGDYILYTIDLSEKENYEIHHIREELNNTLIDYL